MQKFENDGEETIIFIFDHVIGGFYVLEEIIIEHATHLERKKTWWKN